jgi:membrane associated rhomboid family serine protease
MALTVVQLVVLLGAQQWGGSTFHVTLVRMGAESGPASLGAEAWRLLTAGYLHLGWPHLVGNAVLLLLCGMYLEGLLGPSRLVLLYTLCLLASTLVGALVLPQTLVVGSSGGVCGLVGALLALASRPRAPLPPGHRLVCVVAATLVVASLVHSACACPEQMPSNILHLAGGAMGLVLGMSGVLLWRLPRPWEAEHWFVWDGALAATCVTLFCMGCALVLERPWEVRRAQPLVRLRMPGTPVSIAVPAGAASRTEVLEDATDGGSSSRVFFGDPMRDPISVDITVERLEQAVPEAGLEEATRELSDRLLQEAESLRDGELALGSWPRMAVADGRPVVTSSWMLGSLLQVTRWSMYRDDWLITLDVWSASSGLPESWAPVEMEVVRSVRLEQEEVAR